MSETLTFEEAATELAAMYDRWKADEARAKVLKAVISGGYAGRSDLEQRGKSLYYRTPSGREVRVTPADDRETLNPDKLRALLGDDELFLRVAQVKAVELNVDEWRRAVAEERVAETALLDCVDTSEQAAAVAVAKAAR